MGGFVNPTFTEKHVIPDKPEKVQLARVYVALSNSHHLELVFGMFTEKAVYQSINVGEFSGIDQIKGMMKDFFAKFPDVYWDSRAFECRENGTVCFDFELTATNIQTGERIRRSGSEEIVFNETGYISRLVVT